MNLAKSPPKYDETDQDRMRRELVSADALNVKAGLIVELPKFAKAALPAQKTGGMIYVTDDTGGAVPAFSDGTNWRRVTDRAVIA